MASGQVQRYKLTGNDTISVSKMGQQSVLQIGNYQFELPTAQPELTKFVNQWHQVSSQIDTLNQTATTSGGFANR